MKLFKENLGHVSSIAHDGKVLLFGTDSEGIIWYTVKQSGFEDNVFNPDSDAPDGFEAWKRLPLGESTYDASTVAKFTTLLLPVFGKDQAGKESAHAVKSAVAPVQLVSGMGHLHVFRQSIDNKLLVNRFILDGMTNILMPKLDIRFKRSRQKYEVSDNLKMTKDTEGNAALKNVDAPDFRDMDGLPFYEPAWKLDFIENLHQGWFSPVLVPTFENGKYRWNVFAYDSVTEKVILYTVRASHSGIFDVHDYHFLQPDPKDKQKKYMRTIHGIIKRTLTIKTNNRALTASNGLAATSYNVQKERLGDDGEPQFLKEASRVMLAVPVKEDGGDVSEKAKTAVLSFTVSLDGTLSQIHDTPETDQLFATVNELTLPLNTLEEVKEFIDTTPPPSGVMVGIEQSSVGTVTVLSRNLPESLAVGDNVKITGSKNYNGLHEVVNVGEEEHDTKSFEIAATFNNSEAGFWEVVPKKETGLTFDNMLVSYEKAGDDLLNITCASHQLETGDEVQVTGTRNYDGLYPVKAIDVVNNTFTIDMYYQPGEAVDLKAKKRRSIRFGGGADYLRTGHLKLDPFAIDKNGGRTVSVWVWSESARSQAQLIAGNEDQAIELEIASDNKVQLLVHLSDDKFYSVKDPEVLPLKTWVHYAGTVEYQSDTSKETRLYLCKNGVKVTPRAATGETILEKEKVIADRYPTASSTDAFDFQRSAIVTPITAPESALTLAFWIKTATRSDADIFNYTPSYAQQGTSFTIFNRDFSMIDPGDLKIYVGLIVLDTNVSVNDNQWHHVAVSWESESGNLVLYKDGEEAFSISGFHKGFKLSQASTTSLIFGNGPNAFYGSLGQICLWSKVLSIGEIKSLTERSLTGDESNLVGAWVHSRNLAYDISQQRRHGTLIENVSAERVPKLSNQPRPVRFLVAGSGRSSGSFIGKLSDLRIWNTAQDQEIVKDTMHIPLSGLEDKLAGNWRMGAIVVEDGVKKVPDFSTLSNYAVVHGEPFVSERSFNRKNAADKKVVKYANGDLVAVSHRARYRESFEFKVQGDNGVAWTLNKLNNADDRNNGVKVFQFAYWGKTSRSSERPISFPAELYSQDEFSSVPDAEGWFRASCEFTVPDDVSLVRLFDIRNIRGLWGNEAVPPAREWTKMEVRKHQIEHISDAITRKNFFDDINLAVTGGSTSGTTYDLWEEIWSLELCEADLSKHLQDLLLRIDIVEFSAKFRTEQTTKEGERAEIEAEISGMDTRENWLKEETTRLGDLIKSRSHAFEVQISLHVSNYAIWIARRDHHRRQRDIWEKAGWVGIVSLFFTGQSLHKKAQEIEKMNQAQSSANDYMRKAKAAREAKDREIGQLSATKANYENEKTGIGNRRPKLQARWNILNDRINLLDRYLSPPMESNATLQTWKTTTQEGLERVRASLNIKNNDFLSTFVQNQNAPQSMESVAIDNNKLVTLGALLSFISPKSRLQALESSRGNVELNYFDSLDKLQCTVYDATADSRNHTFEQWLPGSLRPAVEFRDSTDKMYFEDNKTLSVGNNWTLETWFQYPLVAQDSGDAYDTQVLVEDAEGRQIVVQAGRYLGAEGDGAFFETGIDLENAVAPGWHHLAVSLESEENMGFYLDGERHGETLQRYAITFSGENTSDYVKWSNFANFPSTAITVSLWLKTLGRNSKPTALSYGIAGDLEHFTLYDVNPLEVFVGSSKRTTSVSLNDGFWHHVAVTWESTEGALKVYKDGDLVYSPISVNDGNTLESNGTLVLGQEQDTLGGSFDDYQAFDGSIRGLSIWNVERDGNEIRRDMYSTFSGNEDGLVGYWSMETIKEDGQFKLRDLTASPQHGEIEGTPDIVVSSIINQRGYEIKTIGNATGGGKPFGRMAEMRIWGQVLSDQEIAAHSRINFLTGDEPGVVAYYPMNEATGTTVRDHAVGNKTDAVLSGADWKACTGEMNNLASDKPNFKALSFAGSGDYVSANVSGKLGGDEITIEYWFKGTRVESAVRFQYGSNHIVAGWYTGDPVHIFSNDQSTSNGLSLGDVQKDQWHHVAVTWKRGATNGFVSYLDGEVVAKRNAGRTSISSTYQTMQIGTFGAQYTVGQMAEVRVWETARTKEQIIANMHRRLTGKEAGLIVCFPLDSLMEMGYGFCMVRDISPNAIQGDVEGATLTTVEDLFITGNVDKAEVLFFDGNGDYVDCGPIDLVNKSFSFECWAKNSRPGTSNYFATQGATSNYKGLCIGFRDSDQISIDFYSDSVRSESSYGDREWHHFACTYDHTSRTQTVYRDGSQVGQNVSNSHYSGTGNFYLGSSATFKPGSTFFQGCLDDVRLWDHVLTQEDIQNRRNKRLSGKEQGLTAYWPVGDLVEGKLKDRSVAGTHDGTISGAQLVEASSGLPFTTIVTDLATASISSCEYATFGRDIERPAISTSMLRSFRSYCTKPGEVGALYDQRIESLELKWVGNAQFEPTLLGFIEGAPPVPSENLTVDYDYSNATTITLRESEDVSYTWNRTRDTSNGMDLDLMMGVGFGITGGIGIESTIAQGRGGFKGSLNQKFVKSNSSVVTSGSTVRFDDTLGLRGEQELGAEFSHLGKRFVPKNVGYALVVSGVADVFVTRLVRSRRMISYEMRPVEGVPLDINTITFQINPTYIMNGSLDGLSGSQAASERFFPHVPEMRSQYGSLYPASYYRIKEAYALKKQIELWDKDREAYFWNFDVTWCPGLDPERDIPDPAKDANYGNIKVEREEDMETVTDGDEKSAAQKQNEKLDTIQSDMEKESDKANEKAQKRKDEIANHFSNPEARELATKKLDEWQTKMRNLLIRAGKRNIVNTYVWDANGGMHTESQDFANTVEHTIGSNYIIGGTLGGMLDLLVGGFQLDLTALYAGELTQTSSKTANIGKTFSLDVDLYGVESKNVVDLEGKPYQPGEKVGRYRFMSFYLGGNTDNFHDFFDYVVDPEWLAGNSEGARALRQAKAGKPNKSWRVLHRVTYVERPSLEGVAIDTRHASGEDPIAERTVNYFDSLEKQNRVILEELRALQRKIDDIPT